MTNDEGGELFRLVCLFERQIFIDNLRHVFLSDFYQSPSGQIIMFGPKAQTSKQPLLTTRTLPLRFRALTTFLNSSTLLQNRQRRRICSRRYGCWCTREVAECKPVVFRSRNPPLSCISLNL